MTKVMIKTNLGAIELELFDDKAPLTVENFLNYIQSKHFNNTIFHRVIEGFMIQGGGFTKDFKQKPTSKPIKNEATNKVPNLRGTIAMARTSEVDSATSQFFINTVDNPFLNNQGDDPHSFGYCVFGKVISGMDVVDDIEKASTTVKAGHRDVPEETIEILEITQS